MNKNFNKIGTAVAALSLALASGVASAAVDISSEVGSAKTDIGTAGALVIGVVVAVAVFSWIRRVIK